MAISWGSLFKQLAIGVAVNIAIQALTGGGDDAPDPGMPKPPESDPDKPLPLFWGTHRLGLNVFRAARTRRQDVKQSKSFLGIKYGSQVVGYEYYMTAAAWLGHGQLAGVIDWIINNTKVVSRIGLQSYQVEGVPVSGLTNDGQVYQSRTYSTLTGPPMTPAKYFATQKWPDGSLNFISARNVLGDQGGVAGKVWLYPGDGAAKPNAALEVLNAIDYVGYSEPAYPEWAYIVFDDVYMGNSPQFPSIECVASRSTPMLGSGAPLMPYEQRVFMALPFPYAPNPGLVEGDANPAGVLWEMMTSHKTGLGIPNAFMYRQDWIDAWEQFVIEDFGLSPMVDSIRAGEDDINDVCRHIDAVIYFDLQMGKYRMRLLRPFGGDPNTLPLLDKTVLTSVEYAETAANQNVNQVNVEFTNVYRDFLKDVVKVQNLAAIQQAERVNIQVVQYPSIRRPNLALQVGQRDLRVQSTVLGRGQFVGNRSMIQYTPGQLVRILWPEKGLFGKVVRIGEIDYGSFENGQITGTFIEDYWSLEAPSYQADPPAPPAPPPTQWQAPSVQVDVAIDTLVSIVYNLLITDPSLTVTDVAYSEQVGAGAQTPWVSDTDGVYDYEMLKNPVYSTRAFYRVSYTDQNGVTQYIVGEFPPPTVGSIALTSPSLSYVYSGANVVVTATVPTIITGVRFKEQLNTPPSDVAVQAGPLDGVAPFTATYPAPTGTDILYVGALDTDGTQISGITRIAIPPAPTLDTPDLTFVYSGANVIITATVGAGVTGVRFATAINAVPTQTDVDTASTDSTIPYSVTVVAPVGTELLYVAAEATNGTIDSGLSRLTIPPQPIDIPALVQSLIPNPTIQYPFGNGSSMGSVGDWLATSPDFNGNALRWKARFLNAARAQVTGSATFSVKKVRESDGALVDMVGGVLTIASDDESAENGASASGWTVPGFLADDEIIVTLESLTNPNNATSLLFTLTVVKV